MTAKPIGYDALLQEAWASLHCANHMAVAYRYRATQLTNWKRLRDFISLGVTPGLLIAISVWENALLRNILLVISGVCSVSSWLWFIFGFSYNWENQLRLSIEIPKELSIVVPKIREEIEAFAISRNNTHAQNLGDTVTKLRDLISQVRLLIQEIEREQVHVKPWMSLLAQQKTMKDYEGKCGTCNQQWVAGSEILNSEDAKRFLEKAQRNQLKGICKSCGQKLPKLL